MLNLIQGSSNSKEFHLLDELLDTLWNFDLKPGFELMGNPSDKFNDFSDPEVLDEWYKLLQDLVLRYMNRYGEAWVKHWKFETWNEPDHKDFCNVNFTTSSYLRYFDASISALKSISKKLILGGPGGSCRHPHFVKFCFALLEHVENGVNSYNASILPSLDFFSFHKKGDGQNMDVIISMEKKTLNEVRTLFPKTELMPVVNDEADPLKGWWKSKIWRAGVEYAIFIAENIENHKAEYVDRGDDRFKLLSNDNAFFSYPPSQFTQRTILARFPKSNTSYSGSFFIKKPVYNFMTLQSFISGTWLNITNQPGITMYGSQRREKDMYFKWTSAIIVASRNVSLPTELKVHLTKIPMGPLLYRILSISDEESRNPYKQWIKMGKPVQLSSDQKKLLLESSQLAWSPSQHLQVSNFSSVFHLVLNRACVQVLLLCSLHPVLLPPQPNTLLLNPLASGLLITFRFPHFTSCLSFSVEWSPFSPLSGFSVLTNVLLDLSYQLLKPRRGWYRVRAIDISGRKGFPTVSKYWAANAQ